MLSSRRFLKPRSSFGYKVKRADEDADPGMIGDRVISDIIHAELVVADLTDLNPNAFYELGIRHSTEKPTIHIARSGTPLPFDNVAHRTIFVELADWQSIQRGRAQLAQSGRTIQDPGFQVSNPITQANASFKMRKSADPRDRVIAELQERVSALEMRSSALAQNRAGDDDFALPRPLDDVMGFIQAGLKAGHTPHNVAQTVTHMVSSSDPETIVKYLRERPDLQCEEFGLFKKGHQFAGFIVPKSE
jgi:hypothetical protein